MNEQKPRFRLTLPDLLAVGPTDEGKVDRVIDAMLRGSVVKVTACPGDEPLEFQIIDPAAIDPESLGNTAPPSVDERIQKELDQMAIAERNGAVLQKLAEKIYAAASYRASERYSHLFSLAEDVGFQYGIKGDLINQDLLRPEIDKVRQIEIDNILREILRAASAQADRECGPAMGGVAYSSGAQAPQGEFVAIVDGATKTAAADSPKCGRPPEREPTFWALIAQAFLGGKAPRT